MSRGAIQPISAGNLAWCADSSEPDWCDADQSATPVSAVHIQRKIHLILAWRLQRHQEATEIARRQSQIALIRLATPRWSTAQDDVSMTTDLPHQLPPMREEIAIWRSFLAQEIHAILFGGC